MSKKESEDIKNIHKMRDTIREGLSEVETETNWLEEYNLWRFGQP